MRRRSTNRLISLGVGLALTVVLTSTGSGAYRRPGRTSVVSVSVLGDEPILGHSAAPAITPNGRYVAFVSHDPTIVVGDTNVVSDVFVHDLRTGATSRVSVTSDGIQAIGGNTRSPFDLKTGSFGPAITPNGRFVAFASFATNLVPNDSNLSADVFVHDRRTHRTERVSLGPRRVQGDGPSGAEGSLEESHVTPGISADGRFVVFASSATNLVRGDTNGRADVFVADRRTDKVRRMSVSSAGVQTDRESTCGSIDAAGRKVVFTSSATNLVADDTNRNPDVFMHDRHNGKTIIVSRASDGSQSDQIISNGSYSCSNLAWADSAGSAISANGRYVMFGSSAPDLVPNDTNERLPVSAGLDVFVHDLKTRRTERVSVDSYGAEGLGHAWPTGNISSNGRYVAFSSSQYLDATATSETCDLDCRTLAGNPQYFSYVRDRFTGATEMVSVNDDGAMSCQGGPSSLSRSGRRIAFVNCPDESLAQSLGLATGTFLIWLRDRGDALGLGRPDASVRVSGDPNFTQQGFVWRTDPRHDVPVTLADLGADLTGIRLALRPRHRDLYVSLEMSSLPGPRGGLAGKPAAGHPGLVYGVGLETDSRYEVRIARLGAEDPIAGPSFALYRCDPGSPCTKVDDLAGDYGAVGERVSASVPFTLVGLERGGKIRAVTGFTALGVSMIGSLETLDEVRLAGQPMGT